MLNENHQATGLSATFDKKESIKLGVILGIISLLLGIIVLFVTKSVQSFVLLTSLSFGVNTIVYMLIAFYFSYRLRASVGGKWNFSVALKSIFFMLLISTLISVFGTMLYVHVINPSLQEEVLRNTINVTIEFMENSGAPDDIIDARVANLEDHMETIGRIQFTDAFRGLTVSILVQFIFSLLLAAVTRNEKLG